ncbi:MAG: 3-methyladenine DNA glycosylase, partial [Gammaproteobacteria bacterium]
MAAFFTTNDMKDGKTLKRHIEDLIQLAPPFAGIYAITGTPVYTPNPGGFTQLLNAIVSQQLSLKAAKAIWQRLVDNNLVSQTAIMSASPAQLRSCGLSQQKIRYAKSLAEQQIDYSQLEHLEDE